MSLKNKIINHLFIYSGSFIFVQILNVFIGIYIRNVLGPAQMGTWVIVQIFIQYTKYSNLGIGRAAAKSVPILKGQGRVEEAKSLVNTAFTFITCSTIFFSLIIIVAAFIFRSRVSPLVFYSSLAIAMVTMFQRISNFCVGMLRAEKEFEFAGKYNVASSIMNAFVTVFLVSYLKLYGYYIAMVLSVIFNLMFLISSSHIKFRLGQGRLNQLKPLLSLGIPLLGINLLNQLFTELDRISIALFLPIEQLGIYSLVAMTNNVIYIFPNILNMVIWPYLGENFGSQESTSHLKKLLSYPNEFIAIYLPILIAGIWLFLPWLVQRYLLEYADGLLCVKFAMFAIMFRLMSDQMNQSLITFDRHYELLPVLSIVCAISFVANFLLLKNGFQIASVAFVMLIANLFIYLGYTIRVFRDYFNAKECFFFIGGNLIKPAYALVVLMVLDYFFKDNLFMTGFLKAVIFFIFYLPVAWSGEKKFKLINTLISKLKY